MFLSLFRIAPQNSRLPLFLQTFTCYEGMRHVISVESWQVESRPSNHVWKSGCIHGNVISCKIEWLQTTTTVKHATAHDQNHVTVHFSRVVLRLRWVVELFRVVGTTENILLVFCRLGNSRISSFRKKVFNSPALSEREAKYVSCV